MDLIKERSTNTTSQYVLVVLPIFLDSCREILQLCIDSIQYNCTEQKVIVKHHPAYTTKDFLSIVQEANNDMFEVTDQSLNSCFSCAKIMISAASSSCLEGALFGIPVVIIGSRNMVTLNPLLGLLPSNSWSVAYNKDEFLKAISKKYVTNYDKEYYIESLQNKWLYDFATSIEK